MNASYWEGKFATEGDGLNYMSGLTYDGTAIDYQTGLLQVSYLREFSAPSKECMHISLLALALHGNPYALTFFSSGSEEFSWNGTVQSYVLDQLTKKMTSYENFQKANPGFGGFLPWFSVNDTGLYRMDSNTANVNGMRGSFPNETEFKVPGQDNGELIWSLIAAYKALNDSGNSGLAKRYKDYIDTIHRNMALMFLDKNSSFAGLRCGAYFNLTTIQPNTKNYWGPPNCWLDDPYGNELLWVYFDLYVAPDDNFTHQQILQRKLDKIVPVDLATKWGNITVERGQGYTIHEKWKFLFLPYFDSTNYEKVYLNGEKARTYFSFMHNHAGLFSNGLNYSIPDQEKTYLPDYVSGGIYTSLKSPILGIPELSTNNASNVFYNPHACGGLLLHPATIKYGIAWYVNTLLGGPRGASEAISLDGIYISPIHTWDSKISTVLAFSGGIIDIIRDYMKSTGTYEKFVKTFDDLYGQKFKNMRGLGLEFKVPPVNVPPSGASFSACNMNIGVVHRENNVFIGVIIIFYVTFFNKWF